MVKVIRPAIAIAAYNRQSALQRLLNALDLADYTGYQDITLVISVDRAEVNPVANPVQKVADSFNWRWGEKKVIYHERHLGLTPNILFCGDLSEEYDAVIVLEDDLIVSPGFYHYACAAIEFYRDRDYVAGISLYSDIYNEYAQMRFIPLDDGYDNYFLQIAASWGQIWTKQQWLLFRSYYQQSIERAFDTQDTIPEFVISWPDPKDWKKHFIRYLVDTQRYFVVPRSSLSTNCGEQGTHIVSKHGNYHTYLLWGTKQFHFSSLEESRAVYDCHYEISAQILQQANPKLRDYNFTVDFYGSKNLSKISTPYVLTVRDSQSAIASFAAELVPPELNITFDLTGEFFHLSAVANCSNYTTQKKLAHYIYLHQYGGIKRYLALGMYSWWQKLQS